MAEAEAQTVIAAVGAMQDAEMEYEDILKLYEATSTLTGGPAEAAGRAEFKRVTVMTFDQQAAEDRLQEVKQRHEREEREYKANLASADNWLKQRAATKKTSKKKKKK